MRTPLMAGNWKMYKTASETASFFEQFRPLVEAATERDIVICPTYVNLPAAVEAVKGSIGLYPALAPTLATSPAEGTR